MVATGKCPSEPTHYVCGSNIFGDGQCSANLPLDIWELDTIIMNRVINELLYNPDYNQQLLELMNTGTKFPGDKGGQPQTIETKLKAWGANTDTRSTTDDEEFALAWGYVEARAAAADYDIECFAPFLEIVIETISVSSLIPHIKFRSNRSRSVSDDGIDTTWVRPKKIENGNRRSNR